MADMRRRDFITLLGGAAAAWPLVARAQQPGRMRRIGVLTSGALRDPDTQADYAAFLQGLEQLGWSDGRNVRIERRSAMDIPERQYAAEMVALAPDIIVTSGGSVGPLLRLIHDVPIVFVGVVDPVGSGYVASLAQPGGNVTGFLLFEYSLAGKWLELLKQVAPDVTRAAVLRDAASATGIGQFAVIQAVAPPLGVDVSPIDLRNAAEIERAVATFVRRPNGGLITTASALMAVHGDLIIALAARHRLPAIFTRRRFVTSGGLISYGPNPSDPWKPAAAYVDRILKGAKPADLPVQAPTRYELVINLKAAKALALDVPPPLLARADEVIE
jgi:putative tryptophan/tyrosine transport system substrate-binding protein